MCSEESIRPALMILARVAVTGPLLLFSKQRAQPSAHKTIDRSKGRAMRMFEVVEPAPQGGGQVLDHLREAHASGPTGLRTYIVEQLLPALLPDPSLPRFKPIPQKVEPLSLDPTVTSMGLVGVQGESIRFYPQADFLQCRRRRFRTRAQHDKVVGVTHHAIAAGHHPLIQRVQVAIGKQRADHASHNVANNRKLVSMAAMAGCGTRHSPARVRFQRV